MTRHSPRCLQRSWRFGRRLFEDGFLLASVQFFSCFGYLLFRKFRDDRLQSAGRFRGHFTHDYGTRSYGKRYWNRRAKTSEGFFSLLLPLRATESLGGGSVPASCFGVRAGLLMNLRQFKRDHGIVRAFVQRAELAGWIRAGSRLADACLDLSPIAHCWVLYQRRVSGASGTRGNVTWAACLPT